MKMTDIRIEWTDTGAVVSYETTSEVLKSAGISCPRCGEDVESGIEHRCGDQVIAQTKAPRKKRAKGESR